VYLVIATRITQHIFVQAEQPELLVPTAQSVLPLSVIAMFVPPPSVAPAPLTLSVTQYIATPTVEPTFVLMEATTRVVIPMMIVPLDFAIAMFVKKPITRLAP
jgi:hypothetical protein